MNLRARLAKLPTMSVRELAWRLSYGAYVACERELHRADLLARPDRLKRALDPALTARRGWEHELASRRTVRFFPATDDPEAFRTCFARRCPDEWQKARDIGDEVASGSVTFFGRTFSIGDGANWHTDPVTGALWPVVYHRDVPVHGGDVGYGDVKYVWEANRHQFFVDLAKTAFLDGSVRHADALHRMLRDWCAAVPYATGPAWACALEPAFRVWSWLWAYHLVRAAGVLDTQSHLLWLTGFYDHGRFLYRHLERFSSPYNHLIGEASALYALGLLFPEFRAAGSWVRRSRSVLESSVESQFHADGGSVEQSTFYHHATLGFYLLAAVLARRNDVALSPAIWTAIERGIQFSAALVQPDGRVPRVGGGDDGKPIRLEHLPFWDFRPYQAIGAVVFARPDFKFVAGRFWEDALWMLGPDGAESFDRLDSREPQRAVSLPESGYCVVRSGWSTEDDYLLFDCGPQAAGLRHDDVPSAAHGHADCLSVVVALGGREVLVDPGFYCYNGDARWEVDFRRTLAHNTLSVDGQDQAQHVSKMAWSRTYSARLEEWSLEQAWARGSHDGYARTASGVTHRRTAWLRPGGYVVIRDELTGTAGHRLQAVFQFAPGRLGVQDGGALFDGRYELSWLASVPVRPRVVCGGAEPTGGWVAPSLGVRYPAPRLELELPMPGPRVVLLTILADRSRAGTSLRQRIVTMQPSGRSGAPLSARVATEGGIEEVSAIVEDARASGEGPLVCVRRIAAGHLPEDSRASLAGQTW